MILRRVGRRQLQKDLPLEGPLMFVGFWIQSDGLDMQNLYFNRPFHGLLIKKIKILIT